MYFDFLRFQLMKHVRLPLISREFLMTHVDSENLVRENTECKELLLEAMRYHLLPEQRSSFTSIRTTSRKPDGMKPYLFAIGTYSKDALCVYILTVSTQFLFCILPVCIQILSLYYLCFLSDFS